MALTANVSQSITGDYTAAAVLGTSPTWHFGTTASAAYSTGTGAGQVDKVYAASLNLAASGTANLDLAGSLTDVSGATITFARIKAIHVEADAGNTNDVQVTRPASNGVPFLMAAGDGIALRPGASFSWKTGTADATGVAVTAGTGDQITFTNSAGTTGVTYKVVILGCSA